MATARIADDGIPVIFHLIARHRHLIVPLSFLGLIGVLVVPLPPAILDVLICFNIALGAIVLMTTIYMRKPLDFSVFPALLLGTTLGPLQLVAGIALQQLDQIGFLLPLGHGKFHLAAAALRQPLLDQGLLG